MQKILHSFLYIISFLLAIIVSIKNLREPDIWWQIRTGEWIIAHHKVPTTDVFSFTQQGQEWINIKWGFEVLAALIAKYMGPESVFILQMIVTALILFFIKKIFNLFKLDTPALFFVSTVLLLFAIEYRIVGRPELFSHLMVVLFLYLLLLFNQTKSKLIFVVIPLQILWCNLHEAYAIGIVMLGIYTVIAWIKSMALTSEKPYLISGVTVLSIAGILINPRGSLLLMRPFNIFGQVQKNKYTTELDSFFNADYWHKESWYFVLIALLFLYFIFKIIKDKQYKSAVFIFPLEYLGICFAFLILAFTAYRNIVFFQLTVIPIVAYFIQTKFKKTENYPLPLAFTGVFLYLFIVSNKYYEVTKSRDRFGLEVLSTNNPAGAAQFVEVKNLQSKKCFSDYLTSSYLLWKLQPDFKTYIDLRDLDIFSTQFFEQYFDIINKPEKFIELDKKENFDYVILYRRSNEALHHYLYNDSVYACTFVDAVAAVYQKTDDLPNGDIFQNCQPIPQSQFSESINHIFNPMYHTFDYDQVSFDFEAASFYTNVGKISLAEKRINQFLAANPQNENAQILRAQIMSLKSQLKK